MTDHYAHGYADDEDDTDLPAGYGTRLLMGGPHDIRRGGVEVDLTDVRPPAPSLEKLTSERTVAAGLFAIAAAIDRLAEAVSDVIVFNAGRSR
jgi:hypothetical protein